MTILTAGTRRTGWLDREIDWETSPLDNGLRTTDLVHRRYTPHTGSLNAPDPLWTLSTDASSYHYGRHDPINTVDPWGLNEDEAGKSNGGVTDGKSGTATIPPPVPLLRAGGMISMWPMVLSAELNALLIVYVMEQAEQARRKATELDKNANPRSYNINVHS